MSCIDHDTNALDPDGSLPTETGLLTAAPSLGLANGDAVLEDELSQKPGYRSPSYSSSSWLEHSETPVDTIANPYHHPPATDSSKIPDVPLGTTLRVRLPESTLGTPKSCYEPFEPGVPIVSEVEAVRRLLYLAKQAGQDDSFIEFQLDNFAVYCDAEFYPEQM